MSIIKQKGKKRFFGKILVLFLVISMIILVKSLTNNNSKTTKLALQKERADVINKIVENNMMEEEEISEDNCEYVVTDDGEVHINFYQGETDSVVIPDEIDGKKVESLDTNAFEDNLNIEMVKMPRRVSDKIGGLVDFEINEELSDKDNVVYTTTQQYNEEYIHYVALSEEEKAKSEIIPEKFEVSIDKAYSKEMASLYGNIGTLAENLPSKFDLRSKISLSVENQGHFGTCYAYASLSSVETYLALNQNTNLDFSEVHAAVLSNCGYGGRFDLVDTYYFKKAIGPVSDVLWSRSKAERTSELNKYLSGGGRPSNLNSIKEQMLNNEPECYVTQTVSMPSISGYMKTNAVYNTQVQDVRNQIKTHIMNYGSLYASVCAGGSDIFTYYNGKQVMADTKDKYCSNHAISLVGWDDNFSKNNFPSSMGVTQDGAYLAMNSWGTSWGNGGYFWISYQDCHVERRVSGVTSAVVGKKLELTPDMFDIEYGPFGETSFEKTGNPIEVKLNNIYFTLNGERVNAVTTGFKIVGFKDNIEEGTGKVLIEGAGAFDGIVEVPFKIELPGVKSDIEYEVIPYEGVFDGKDHSASIIVKSPSNAVIRYKYRADSTDYVDVREEEWYKNYNSAGYHQIYYAIGAPGYNTVEGTTYVYIEPKPIDDFTVTLSQYDYIYDGSAKTPQVTIKDGDHLLYPYAWDTGNYNCGLSGCKHYDLFMGFNISYIDNLNAGTATVHISGNENYIGTLSKTFTIKQNASDPSTIHATAKGYKGVYDGKEHGIKVEVDSSITDATVLYGTQAGVYDLSESPKYKNKSVNTVYYKISASGYADYEGFETVEITQRTSLDELEVIFDKTEYIYTGEPIIPKVIIKDGDKILTENECGRRFSNNTNIGNGKVTLTGYWNYYGTRVVEFPIVKGIDLDVTEFKGKYDGEEHGITANIIIPKASTGEVKYGLTANDCSLEASPKFKDAGTYNVYYKASETGYNDRVGSARVIIEKVSLNDLDIILDKDEYIYNGNEIKPIISIKDENENILEENIDYTCEYFDNTNIGIASLKITGIGNYKGEADMTFKIVRNIGSDEILARNYKDIYDGKQHGTYVDISALGENANIMFGTTKGEYTEERSPYYVSVGNYTVYYKVTSPDIVDYEGEATIEILPRDINETTVYISTTEFKYDGTAKVPEIMVLDDGNTDLKVNVDYTYTITDNINPGKAKVEITGIGNYEGTALKEFSIISNTFSNLSVSSNNYEGVYDGASHGIIVNIDSAVTDAKIKYGMQKGEYTSEQNITFSNVGTHYIYYMVSEDGYYDYEGVAQVKITPKDIKNASEIIDQDKCAYDGTAKEPLIGLQDGSIRLNENKDYTCMYTNNINKGTAIINITGKGNYTGTKQVQFEIKEKLIIDLDELEEEEIDGKKYIKNIVPGTSVKEIKEKIGGNGTVKIYDNSTPPQEITDENEKIKTGTKVVIEKVDTNEKEEFNAVVTGDLDGDGEITGVDLLKLARFLVELDNNLEGPNYLAANVYKDPNKNNKIDNADLLKIARILAGLDTL